MSDIVYIALGSNLGNRAAMLEEGRRGIAALEHTRILAATEAEETEPLGDVLQGKFLNQMIAVSTGLEPRTLLAALHRVEHDAGRVRREKWGPRTLDLDIVMIEGSDYHDDVLTVPHPELPNRDFWLRHLQELRGRTDG